MSRPLVRLHDLGRPAVSLRPSLQDDESDLELDDVDCPHQSFVNQIAAKRRLSGTAQRQNVVPPKSSLTTMSPAHRFPLEVDPNGSAELSRVARENAACNFFFEPTRLCELSNDDPSQRLQKPSRKRQFDFDLSQTDDVFIGTTAGSVAHQLSQNTPQPASVHTTLPPTRPPPEDDVGIKSMRLTGVSRPDYLRSGQIDSHASLFDERPQDILFSQELGERSTAMRLSKDANAKSPFAAHGPRSRPNHQSRVEFLDNQVSNTSLNSPLLGATKPGEAKRAADPHSPAKNQRPPIPGPAGSEYNAEQETLDRGLDESSMHVALPLRIRHMCISPNDVDFESPSWRKMLRDLDLSPFRGIPLFDRPRSNKFSFSIAITETANSAARNPQPSTLNPKGRLTVFASHYTPANSA